MAAWGLIALGVVLGLLAYRAAVTPCLQTTWRDATGLKVAQVRDWGECQRRIDTMVQLTGGGMLLTQPREGAAVFADMRATLDGIKLRTIGFSLGGALCLFAGAVLLIRGRRRRG
jgi:hypothetical protein